jgi:hypothetical protein
MQQEWVVYTRHGLNQADSVVDYLARYTHRTAISNGRLLSMEGDQASFRYKDYRDSSRIILHNGQAQHSLALKKVAQYG